MEFFRYRSDAWGQRILEGMSWDLLWVFVGAAVLFIVFHAIYTARKMKEPSSHE